MLNNILLVDDDEATNCLHEIVLGQAGIAQQLHMARDGKEALQLLVEEPPLRPELILLDINMPGFDGFDFLEEYQNYPASLKQTTIIAMVSTSLLESDRLRSQRYSEVVGFLPKPLTEEAILSFVKHHFPAG